MTRVIYLLTTVGFLFLASCSSESPSISRSISAAAVLSSDASSTDKAAFLADQADALLAANGYQEAFDLSAYALKLDGTNQKASFIHAFTSVLVDAKGLLSRVSPLFLSAEYSKTGFQSLLISIEKSLPASVYAWLAKGTPEITTELELQNELDHLIQTLDTFRVYLRDVPTGDLTFSNLPFFNVDLQDRYASSCEVRTNGTLDYEIKCSDAALFKSIKLGRADLKYFEVLVSEVEVALALANSYSIDGVSQFQKDHSSETVAPGIEVLAQHFNSKAFGLLRSSNQLAKVAAMGTDGLSALSLLAGYTNCAMGMANPKNRAGFLFNLGFCKGDPDFRKQITTSNQILSTNTTVLELGARESYDPTRARASYVDPSLFYQTPLNDLRIYGSLKFDKCHHLVGIGDGRLNGIFPYSDLNNVLATNAGACATP